MKGIVCQALGLGLCIGIILSEISMAAEYYKVQVTRKSEDLYAVVGQGIYVKTRYCYEYVYYAEAIIKIESPSGYNVGEIYFVGSGGGRCDVERLLR
jgi:hypothetical protein